MNRKLITLAVAAALAAPTAAMAEAILYGRLNVSIDYVDVDANAYWLQGSTIPGTGGLPRSGGTPNFGQALNGFGGNANNDFAPVRDFNGNLVYDAQGRLIPSGNGYQDFPGAMALNRGASNNLFVGNQLIPVNAIVGQTLVDPVTYSAGNRIQVVQYLPNEVRLTRFDQIVGVDVPVTTTVYGNVFNNRVTELTAAGWDALTAAQVARNDALAAAWSWASDAQRNTVSSLIRGTTGGQSFKGWGLNMNPRASRIGVKGSENLGGDLKAIYQVELNIDLAEDTRDNNLLNGNRANGFSFRNTFVGLAGNWGSVLVGRHDTPMKLSTGKLDMFADTLADFNHTVGIQDLRADNVIAYISPSFSGFTFSAAIVPSGGATGGAGFNSDSDSIAGAYSLAGVYSNGPFFVSLAYENLGSEMFMASNPFAGQALYQGAGDMLSRAMFGSGLEDDTKWRVGLGLLDWNGFTLSGVYENHSNVNGAPKDADMSLWQIQAGYAFGNSQVKAMYGQSDVDGCVAPFTYTCTTGIPDLQNKDKSTWAIGFDHNFSKRTKVYALYTAMDDDYTDADWSGFSLGMMHSF